MNYTQKTLKKHFKQPHNCTKYSRCHNYKQCEHCSILYRKREYSKATKHLLESDIKKFKYKYYIVITSHLLHTSTNEKNSNIDLFLKEFLVKKRNKSWVINKESQYFITKEISFNKNINEYNPHFNMVLLTNKKLNYFDKGLQKLIHLNNIDFFVKSLYKTNRLYLDSIKKIINYSLKFDSSRAFIEKYENTTKFKRNILKSDLFNSAKFDDLHERLYIHIQVINNYYKFKINQAKEILKRNLDKRNTKYYIKLLKSYRKKKKYFSLVNLKTKKRIIKKFNKNKFDDISKYPKYLKLKV